MDALARQGVHVRLTRADLARLDRLAKNLGTTATSLTRAAARLGMAVLEQARVTGGDESQRAAFCRFERKGGRPR